MLQAQSLPLIGCPGPYRQDLNCSASIVRTHFHAKAFDSRARLWQATLLLQLLGSSRAPLSR